MRTRYIRYYLTIIFIVGLLLPAGPRGGFETPLVMHLWEYLTYGMTPWSYFSRINNTALKIAYISSITALPILGVISLVLFRKYHYWLIKLYQVVLIPLFVLAAYFDRVANFNLLAYMVIIAIAIIVEMCTMIYLWWQKEPGNNAEAEPIALKPNVPEPTKSQYLPIWFVRLILAIFLFLALLLPVEWNTGRYYPFIFHILISLVWLAYYLPQWFTGGIFSPSFILGLLFPIGLFAYPILGIINYSLFRKPNVRLTKVYRFLLFVFFIFSVFFGLNDFDLTGYWIVISFAIIVELLIMVYAWWKNLPEPSDNW